MQSTLLSNISERGKKWNPRIYNCVFLSVSSNPRVLPGQVILAVIDISWQQLPLTTQHSPHDLGILCTVS